jgi:uncharacterized YigZ family protein
MYIFCSRISWVIIIKLDSYLTIKQSLRKEIKIKDSSFLASISPTANQEEAARFVEDCKKQYFDATHNCFAYKIDESVYRFSDDGEPSGTAGRPILNMLEKYDLFNVVLVVTRYFGGTKLGIGGLKRAYGKAAETVINQAKIVKKINYKTINIRYPFNQINKVQYVVQRYGIFIKTDSTEKAMVATLKVQPSQKNLICEDLIVLMSGNIEFL